MSSIVCLMSLVVGSDPEPARGQLILAGGGDITEIIAPILEQAGGPRVKLLVVPQASEDADAGERHAQLWRKQGVRTVAILDVNDLPKARAAVTEAELIWMSGGDQSRLVKRLEGTGLVELIHRRYRQGATVGGTSAGAAVASRVMIAGDPPDDRVTAAQPKLANGLSLWPEFIVDQHFVQRDRFNRLLGAVFAHPTLIGVGIAESTAVVVSGAEFKVIGPGPVVVIDARRALPVAAKNGQATVGANVLFHYLQPGMTYHRTRGVQAEATNAATR